MRVTAASSNGIRSDRIQSFRFVAGPSGGAPGTVHRRGAQVHLPLLPAAGVAGRRGPRPRGPGRRARALPGRVIGRVVAEVVVELLGEPARAAAPHVPAGLRVVGGEERELARAVARQVHGAGQALVGLIDVLRVHVLAARVGVEGRASRQHPVRRLRALELGVLVGREHARGHQLRAGAETVALLVARAISAVQPELQARQRRALEAGDRVHSAVRAQAAAVAAGRTTPGSTGGSRPRADCTGHRRWSAGRRRSPRS